jgi:hypothetical protein
MMGVGYFYVTKIDDVLFFPWNDAKGIFRSSRMEEFDYKSLKLVFVSKKNLEQLFYISE